MIGFGTALNKHKKNGNVGLLNKLGISDNAVFVFSPYEKLITSFNDPVIKIQRTSDYTSQWFSFKGNGLLDIDEILAFVGFGDGLVEEVSNQYKDGNNAIQTSLSSKPKIVSGGVFEEDGLLFDGVNDYLQITNYNTLDSLVSFKQSTYIDFKPLKDETKYIFSKNNSTGVQSYTFLQFTSSTYGSPHFSWFSSGTFNYDLGINLNTKVNYLHSWNSYDGNDLFIRTNINSIERTKNIDINNTDMDYIGIGCSLSSSGGSNFNNSNIKTILIFNSDVYDKYYELGNIGNEPLITTWETTNISTGSSNSDQVKLPLESGGRYNFLVDWGDGFQDNITAYNQAEVAHTYAISGEYKIKIYGECIGFRFDNVGDRLKLLNISRWGDRFKLGNSGSYFYGCSNLNISATNQLNTDYMTNFDYFFRDCQNLNWDINFSNTKNVTTVFAMFYNCIKFNGTVEMDLSSCINFYYMFYDCVIFNKPVDFNMTNSATRLDYMFRGCTAFNQSVNSFNTDSVTNMYAMFYLCSSFNQDISNFNFENVTNIEEMLFGATSFSRENYDLLLISLSSQTLTPSLTFDCASYYTLGGSAETAHDDLTDNDLWVVNDLGGVA